MNTVKVESGKTKMVAHRGVSGIEPENSVPAFIAAGNRSYFGIETDVHRTLDGRFVVFHDDNAKRVTGADCIIEETSFEDLRKLFIYEKDGTDGHFELKIPELADYVRICKKYEKVGVLELKNAFAFEDVEKIVGIIKESDYLENIIFISFDFDNLVKIRGICPGQTVQFLFSEYSDEIFEKVKAHGFDIDIQFGALTEENIKKFHNAGIKINCWTCDDKEHADWLIAHGVEYITSNILE